MEFELKDTRSGFGAGILEAAKENKNIVALCADLTGSLKLDAFAKEFPDRFFQTGIAEANMVGIAAGLSVGGKIPFATSFANFITGRVYDQVRQTIAYSNTNVKLCGSHAGITLGEDGATHQILEDFALMKSLPNMVVINPCDYNQTKAATLAASRYTGPVYLRFGRPAVPNFTPIDLKFEIGKALKIHDGKDVSIFATGHLVWQAVIAAKKLEEMGISAEIINIHTIKPLDEHAIIQSVSKTRCAVSAEEHQVFGGLGESIARVLSQNIPLPLEIIGVRDQFGQSGTPDQLMEKYGLTSEKIIQKCLEVIKRK